MNSVPYLLPANQPADRFYAGGSAIAELRRVPWQGGRTPEDWIASTTSLHGHQTLGLSTLPDGRLLRDEIADDPMAWLGEQHLATHGSDPMLLTKLLHAGQRLPVHLHPDGDFAARHLGRAHGKTEAWIILSPGEVHLGFSRSLSVQELQTLVDTQDTATLLASMHRLEVRPGDAVLVPAGMPHAIGAGVLLVEVQEPEDLSILLEWRGYAIDGPAEGHLGLGFDLALTATDRTPRSASEIAALVAHTDGGSLLPAAADRWFRVQEQRGTAELDAGFSVLVAISGDGMLTWDGGTLPLQQGSTVVTPHAAGPMQIDGDLRLLRCRPPADPAPEPVPGQPAANSR